MNTKPIKILHSVLSLEVGGLENGVVNLMNAAPADMQVDVLCLRAEGALVKRVCKGQVILAPDFNNHSIGTAVKVHAQVLKQGRYDVIHTHGWTTLLAGALATWWQRFPFKRKPLIINGEHGVYYADHWRRRLAQKFLFQAIDGNLTVSADLGRRLEQVFHLDATFYPILNGVDLERFSPDSNIRQQQRALYGFTPKHKVIGTVGRLVAVKNYKMLIESFAVLQAAEPELRLMLCGDGDQRVALEQQVQQAGLAEVVVFTGRISTVAETMQAFDVFALSSDMEGLPNTLLEALALGIPAVVTDVGGSREVMPPAVGVLVPPGDLQALTSALQQVLIDSNDRDTLGRLARAHIHKHFSLESMAHQYYEYYRKLLKSKNDEVAQR